MPLTYPLRFGYCFRARRVFFAMCQSPRWDVGTHKTRCSSSDWVVKPAGQNCRGQWSRDGSRSDSRALCAPALGALRAGALGIGGTRSPTSTEAVERAEKTRAPIQKTADRLAGYLVYFAIGCGALTFLITRDVRSTISVVIGRRRVRHRRGDAAGDPGGHRPGGPCRGNRQAASTWNSSARSIRWSSTRRARSRSAPRRSLHSSLAKVSRSGK